MATTEQKPSVRDVREVYDEAKLAERRVPRASRVFNFLTTRLPGDTRERAAINKIILGYSQEPVGLEELESAPHLFTFGEGFASAEERPDYDPGEEPDTAPFTREQMRLLLLGAVPGELIPFIHQHFIFKYSEIDGEPPIQLDNEDGKVVITFHKDNFINEVAPAGYSKDPANLERLKYIRGFQDPSKVLVLMGKIFAQMIDPPEKWQGLGENFAVTRAKSKADEPKSDPAREKEQGPDPVILKKQWGDFIGLAIAAPDVAKQRYPQLYEHYQKSLKDFDYVANDPQFLAKIQRLTFADFNITYDLRTDEQKNGREAVQPQLAWYDHVITFLNGRILNKLGKKIVYQKPDDPARAAYLADSDKHVKELLLTANEATRDSLYGEKLRESTMDDSKDRYEAYAYLLANSQAGEFAEWRIYAWLYKFSKPFRESGGKQIGEQDYKDLQTLYRQSEDQGRRFGTYVMPFEAKRVQDEAHGRAVFIYLIKDRANYLKEVEKKVQAKNDRGLQDVSDEVFNQFFITLPDGSKQAVLFDAKFDLNEPNGSRAPTGDILEILGEGLGRDVVGIMQNNKVERITADAKAVAKAFYAIYLDQGRTYSERMSRESRKVLEQYGKELNRPPEEKIKQALEINASRVAQSEDPRYITEQIGEVQNAQRILQQSIAAAGRGFRRETTTGVTAAEPQLVLSIRTHEHLYRLIIQGQTDLMAINDQMRSIIHKQIFPANRQLADQESLNVFAFLNTIQPHLLELHKLYRQQDQMEPRQFKKISKEAQRLADEKMEDLATVLVDKATNQIDKTVIEKLTALKIVTKTDLDRIDGEVAGGRAAAAEKATAAAENRQPGEPNLADLGLDEGSLLNKKLSLIRQRLAENNNGERLTVKLLEEAVISLRDQYLFVQGTGQYSVQFNRWLKGPGRIMETPPFNDLKRRLDMAVHLMEHQKPATARDGTMQLDEILLDLSRSYKYMEQVLNPKAMATKKAGAKKADDDATVLSTPPQ